MNSRMLIILKSKKSPNVDGQFRNFFWLVWILNLDLIKSIQKIVDKKNGKWKKFLKEKKKNNC